MSYLSPVKQLLLERNAAPVAAMLYEFHTIYGATVHFDDAKIRDKELRQKLITEEYKEVMEAFEKDDIVNLAKELADLVYVVFGTALACGFDLDNVFRQVHASNMSKLGEDGKPILREDGKVLKGPGYFEPDIQGVLF